MFSKVLVANRGEIAIRVIRTLEELGIAAVAVYSEPDRDAPHARRAEEAYLIGPGPATESYLAIEKLIEVARRSGAEAVHPGYGFLAENAAFARACEEAGIVFIGPPAEAIDAMGSKTRARELMRQAGVPIVPGTTDPVESVEEARKVAAEVGYPVAFKAAGGGGGKGFRVAPSEDDLEKAFEGAAREGEKFFSDATVYVERYLSDPRHVEAQVLADSQGNVVHLFERDCSVQRRHQKLIEEPDVAMRGHAIECRINAEDAARNFAPAPGRIASYREPAGPFVRVDSGVEAGYEVLPLYDPLVAKLIVWDVDREASTRRMLRALGEYEIEGLRTLVPFHQALLQTEQWARGETCRDLIADRDWLRALAFPKAEARAEADQAAKVEREYAVEVSGRRFDVKVVGEPIVVNGAAPAAGPARQAPRRRERGRTGRAGGAAGALVSPIQGTVLRVAVEQGAQVDEGALICVIEAMKMENEITAPVAGTVEELGVREGGAVSTGDTIAIIK